VPDVRGRDARRSAGRGRGHGDDVLHRRPAVLRPGRGDSYVCASILLDGADIRSSR
jgi:hypothetical protein